MTNTHVNLPFKKILPFFLVISTFTALGQNNATDSLVSFIKEHPVISMGGAEPLLFNGEAILVSVGAVEIKGQTRSALERLGKIRAEKEIIALMNGSDFTSSVKMVLSQTITNNNGTTNVSETVEYIESIAENTEGFIRSMKKLASWKADDGGMYYYAIFKPIKKDIIQ